MSFNAKDMTQGGQIAFMRLRMLTQVSNLLFYCLFILFFVVLAFTLIMRLSWQNLVNGLVYWWCSMLEGFPSVSPSEAIYHLDYYDRVLNYTPSQILKDAYTVYCGQLIWREAIFASLVALGVCILAAAITIWVLGRQGKEQSQDEITGGRTLTDDPRVVAKMLKRDGNASDIKIDSLPLVKNAEVKNFCLLGSVGTGKSVTMRKLMDYARKRGDMVIVYDKSCDFVKDFYDPQCDKILNPQDARCVAWDLWRECLTLPDFENVANTLIPMGSSEDPFWQGSARTIFAEAAYMMRNDPERSYAKLLDTLLSVKLSKLREYLAGMPSANLVEEKIEKTAISIRSVLTNYAKAFRYMQGIESNGESFTIRDWMRSVREDRKNGWLFITSDSSSHASLKPVISMWLSIASRSLLSMGENADRRVWIFADELPTLHKLPDLVEIVPEARKFGGCFVLGFQSNSQLEDIYGVKSAATLNGVLNTRFFFRAPDKISAEYAAGEIGEKEFRKADEQYSYGADPVRDGVSLGKELTRDQLVSYSGLQTLPDLTCYITLPGPYPAIKMKLKYQKRAQIAPTFLPRAYDTETDRKLAAVLAEREREGGLVSALFERDDAIAVLTGNVPAAQIPTTGDQTQVASQSSTAAPIAVVPPVAVVANSTSEESAVQASGGQAQVIKQKAAPEDENDQQHLVPGMNDDGEIVDMNLYDEWAASRENHSQQAMHRREEVNINRSQSALSNEEIDF